MFQGQKVTRNRPNLKLRWVLTDHSETDFLQLLNPKQLWVVGTGFLQLQEPKQLRVEGTGFLQLQKPKQERVLGTGYLQHRVSKRGRVEMGPRVLQDLREH